MVARTGAQISNVVYQYVITPINKLEMAHPLTEGTPEYRHVVIRGHISTITVDNCVISIIRKRNNIVPCPLCLPLDVFVAVAVAPCF